MPVAVCVLACSVLSLSATAQHDDDDGDDVPRGHQGVEYSQSPPRRSVAEGGTMIPCMIHSHELLVPLECPGVERLRVDGAVVQP